MDFITLYSNIQDKSLISGTISKNIKKLNDKDKYKLINYYFIHLLYKNPEDTAFLEINLRKKYNYFVQALNNFIVYLDPGHQLNSRHSISRRKIFGPALLNKVENYFGIKLRNKINKDYWGKGLYQILYKILLDMGKKDYNSYKIIKALTFIEYIINEISKN